MSLTEIQTSGERETERWPIFVISLVDAHERRQRMQAQFAELGLEFEFFDAIDGRSGLPVELEAEVDRDAVERSDGRVATDPELACALSHRFVYQRIVEDGLPGAVILEDDAILGPEFRSFMTGQGYRESDFIQMMYMTARHFRRGRRRWSEAIELAPLAENSFCAAAYSISASGAHYLLSRTKPLQAHADWPCDMLPLHPMITLPRLVNHPPLTTEQSYLMAKRAPLLDFRRRELLARRAAAGSRWKR